MSYTIFDVAKDFLQDKLEYAKPEIVDWRREVCNSCNYQNKLLNTCTRCYCYIPTKTSLKKSECPEGKW